MTQNDFDRCREALVRLHLQIDNRPKPSTWQETAGIAAVAVVGTFIILAIATA